jgi:hypothetical protein
MDASLCPAVVGRSRSGKSNRRCTGPAQLEVSASVGSAADPGQREPLAERGQQSLPVGRRRVERQSGEDGDHYGHRGHEPTCADHDSAPSARSQSLPSLRELQVEGVAARRPDVRQYRGTTVQQTAGRTRDVILYCYYTTKPSSLSRKIGANFLDKLFLSQQPHNTIKQAHPALVSCEVLDEPHSTFRRSGGGTRLRWRHPPSPPACPRLDRR